MLNDEIVLSFADTSLGDAIVGFDTVCRAVTIALLGDTTANCSLAIDARSYRLETVPGVPTQLGSMMLRLPRDPRFFSPTVLDQLGEELRAAGFFSTPSARVVVVEWTRDCGAVVLAAWALILVLAMVLATFLLKTRTHHSAYTSVPQR